MAVTIKLYILVIVGRSIVDNTSFVVKYFCLVKFVSFVFFIINLSYILSFLLMK